MEGGKNARSRKVKNVINQRELRGRTYKVRKKAHCKEEETWEKKQHITKKAKREGLELFRRLRRGTDYRKTTKITSKNKSKLLSESKKGEGMKKRRCRPVEASLRTKCKTKRNRRRTHKRLKGIGKEGNTGGGLGSNRDCH